MMGSEKEDTRNKVLKRECGKVVSLGGRWGDMMHCCDSIDRGLLGVGMSYRGDKIVG